MNEIIVYSCEKGQIVLRDREGNILNVFPDWEMVDQYRRKEEQKIKIKKK